PEVHSDGEIWGETLWDLRNALGQGLAESLVTRAMELSPNDPSFLDMRNSILQADKAVNGGRARDTIWAVFAHRGMGFFAAAVNTADTAPIEDFSLPPDRHAPRGQLLGTVTDVDSGLGVGGLTVGFAGHTSGFSNDLADVSKGNGRYHIRQIPLGTYK